MKKFLVTFFVNYIPKSKVVYAANANAAKQQIKQGYPGAHSLVAYGVSATFQ